MIDVILFIAYYAIVFAIAIYSMKSVKTFKDYAVAGRSMPFVLIFASMAATIIGGGGTMGRVNYGYNWGLFVLILSIGSVSNQFLSGIFIAPKMRALAEGRKIYTIADILDYNYGKGAHIVGAAFTFLYSAGIFGAQVLAMGKVLQVVTGLPLIPLSIVATIFVILYTWAGGMKAVIFTDLLQFIILALGLTVASMIALSKIGWIPGMIEGVVANAPKLLDWTAGKTGLVMFSTFLAWMFGEFLAPYFVGRYMSADNPKNAKRSVVGLGVFYGFWVIILLMISLAGITLTQGVDGDKVLLFIIKDYLPVGLVGLCFAALIAAVMSTADSVLNVSAVIYTSDVHERYINKKATDKEKLKMTKVTTIIIGVLGILAAIALPSVLKLVLYVYKIWAPSMIVPLVACIAFGKPEERNVSPYAAVPAILSGLGTFIVFNHFVANPPIPAVFAGMLVNLIVFVTVNVITKNKKPSGFFVPNDLTADEAVSAQEA